ncbi:hypothetical protein TK90_2858 (plasmid) [Thioalkalivibrio sp. K90mix]|uniref:hypothetical protein n=1 Tax=Thioalkalivibrio sp. (strain K90mix) TaxID=396595 RepID=UPI000195A8CD|nr:hypothetical protein [Thioalkalivibrio sp. K90mix]ADC73342.1 hypothetical protein TK90_2858 [Thioalkalivibrio sp. K90mix]
MVNLILVIAALMIGAVLIVASIQYIPADAQVRAQVAEKVERDLRTMEEGVVRYLEDNRGSDGSIDVGGIPRSDLLEELAVDYVFVPPAPSGGSWVSGTGFHEGFEAVWICLQPDEDGWNTGTRQALLDVGQTKADQAWIRGDECGRSTDTGGDHHTYWMVVERFEDRAPNRRIIPAPSPGVTMVLSQDQMATPFYRFDASLAVNLEDNQDASIEVRLEANQGDGGWVIRDRWRENLEASADELTVEAGGFPGQGGGGGGGIGSTTVQPTGTVSRGKTGILSAPLLPGEQVRVVVETSGDADLVWADEHTLRLD